ncbi:DUF5694 domain-containing protein [Erythrobacter sp.]|uniref:DUF5694 domain-containing protein n=1 Tax=Erythrobacter sp. TaxID=1042 RepID=UPI002EBCA90F|nr:DUF5694 domain-containing protein [Erythrobacter sp.]
MPRTLLLFIVALFAASPLGAEDAVDTASAAPAEPVRVMILGSYHFANPGRDMANMQVDDVLAERRQREIAVLVESLARWQPTKIAVETVASTPDLTLAGYARAEELLGRSANESVQIGYRLARMLDHGAVYGFDEQAESGEPGYFPMGAVVAHAEKTGRIEVIERLKREIDARIADEQARLAEQSIAESLIVHNDPDRLDADHDRFYYALLAIGDADEQPGAVLNAMWYMRNAKMFTKLMQVAEPGDRVLAVVGSGHAAWLRDLTRRMPGYELVESLPYVRAAAIASQAGAED